MAEDKKLKALIVEDDVFMVELLAREFQNSGFETTVATCGSEAVEKFRQAKPDIVILDLLLPDSHGADVLRNIRREEGGPEVKVIVLSNVGDVKDIEEAKRLGVTNYLVKANTALPEVVEKAQAALARK